MKRTVLFLLCMALLLCLFPLLGCTEQAPEPSADTKAPADPNVHYADTDTITLTNAHTTISPAHFFVWAESYDESSGDWISADGLSALDWLETATTEQLASLPALHHTDELTITLPRGMTFHWGRCFFLQEDGSYSAESSFSTVTELQEQLDKVRSTDCWVYLQLSEQGRWIESANKYESIGYGAFFRYAPSPKE